MKRLVAAFLCVSLVFTQYKQAEAAVPVVVAGVAAGAVLLLAAGAVNYYSNPSASSSLASAAGNIYSNATAYTQAVSALGQGYLLSQAAALKSTAQGLLDTVSQFPDKYAALKEALKGPQSYPNPKSGDVVSVNGGNQAVTNSPYNTFFTTMDASVFPNSDGTGYFIVADQTYSGGSRMGYFYHNSPTDKAANYPVTSPITADKVPKALTGSDSGGTIPAHVTNDINDAIKNGDLTVTPVSVTGDAVTPDDVNDSFPPYVPPATLPGTSTPVTPSPSLPGTSTGLGSATTTAAQQNVATAQQQVTTAEQQLAADPSSAFLQQQLAAAQQALAAAQAALEQAKAAENEVFVNPLFPTRKTLNLESWRQLVNVLPSKFPFNLLTTLGSYFEPFLAAPVAPAFELHIYQDKKLNIDLSVFDTPVAIFRWGLALLLTFGMVQLLIRWWKGTA